MQPAHQPSRVAILVMTCDKYADVWPAFTHFFFKHWRDCPFPVYLCTETMTCDDPRVTTINSGPASWSRMLQISLESISHEQILLMQEDFLLVRRPDVGRIHRYARVLEAERATMLKLFPSPAPDLSFGNYDDIGAISPGTAFRVSIQASLWNKEALMRLIDPKENPWDFELNATVRAEKDPAPYLSVRPGPEKNLEKGDYPLTYVYTAVQTGLWMPRAVRMCRRDNIEPDLRYRKMITQWRWYYMMHAPRPVQHVMDFISSRMQRIFGLDLNRSEKLPLINFFGI